MGFESDDRVLIDEVVSLGQRMGLKVESEDAHELLKSHEIEVIRMSCISCIKSNKKPWLIICHLMKMR